MRFHLTYRGPLSASASSPKGAEISAIRSELSPQLEALWQTHPALEILDQQGWVSPIDNTAASISVSGRFLSPKEMGQFMRGSMEYLADFIVVDDSRYKPLVRKSLHLNCELSILFLRQQDPGELVSQGGDIDNRIKTLLDALRMPSVDEHRRNPPTECDLFCLMESDTLVSALSVKTDRLLTPLTQKDNEVQLVIEVSLNVLRVNNTNVCLL